MKKILLAVSAMAFSLCSMAQISTSVTMNGTPISGSPFASFSAAVTAVNGLTITGPVVVNATSGQTETLTGPLTLTATGTATNTITIQNSGTAAHAKLISYVGTNTAAPSVTTSDGFLTIVGGDYITIDGIDLEESSANTTATTVMEYGYQLLKASETNGARYNTIKNCNIKLSNVQFLGWTGVGHNGAVGINVLNAMPTATTAVVPTAATGSNSYNKFYSNTITGGQAGIVFVGYAAIIGVGPNPDPTTFLGDIGNDVGGAISANGNTILNFGGGTGASTPATGIFASNQWGMNCSNNTINNNNGTGTNHPNTLRGIFLNSSSTSASLTVRNNTVTTKSGATTSIMYPIDVQFGNTAAGNTIDISRNNILNPAYPTITSGQMYMIYINSSAENIKVDSNTISGLTTGSSITSGTFYGIFSSGSPTNLAIRYNTIDNNVLGASTGGTYGINWSAGINIEIAYNTFSNFSKNNSGIVYGMFGSGSTTNEYVHHNTVKKLVVGTYASTTNQVTMYAFGNSGSASTLGVKKYTYNTIDSLVCGGAASGSLGNGIRLSAGLYDTIAYNNISNLLNFPSYYGIYTGGATTNGICWIYNNNISKLVGGVANTGANNWGIYLGGATTTHYTFNNFISGLTAPNASSGNSIGGVYLAATAATNINHINYNTINLGDVLTSTGANFGGAGIYIHSVNPIVTAKNNIIRIANATANGTGYFAAIKRGAPGTVGTKPAQLTFSRNIYYAPYVYGEGADKSTSINMYYVTGGTLGTVDPNFNTACGLYKIFMQDGGSFFENNLVAGSLPNTFIPSGATFAESNATGNTEPIITTDFNNVIRSATSDVGALEFTGTLTDAAGPSFVYNDIPNPANLCSPVILTTAINDPSVVNSTTAAPRLYYKKSSNSDQLGATNDNTTNGWKYIVANGSGPYTFTVDYSKVFGGVTTGDTIQYFLVAQDNVTSPNVGISVASFASGYCPSSVALSSGAFPLATTTGLKKFVIPTPTATAGTTLSNPLGVCNSSTALINVVPTSGTLNGYIFDVQTSPVGANTWTTVASNLTTLPYTTGTISSAIDYRVNVKNCNGTALFTASPQTISIFNPTITATTPAARCGDGTVTLGATSNAGTLMYWYSDAGLSNIIQSGNSYTTPTLNATTNYYVKAYNENPNQGFAGDGAWNNYSNAGNFATNTIGSAYFVLNVTQNVILKSLDVYSNAAVGSAYTLVAKTGSSGGPTVNSFSGVTTVQNSGTPTTAESITPN